MDALLDVAGERGFLTMIAPIWIRWGGDDREGWRKQLKEGRTLKCGEPIAEISR